MACFAQITRDVRMALGGSYGSVNTYLGNGPPQPLSDSGKLEMESIGSEDED